MRNFHGPQKCVKFDKALWMRTEVCQARLLDFSIWCTKLRLYFLMQWVLFRSALGIHHDRTLCHILFSGTFQAEETALSTTDILWGTSPGEELSLWSRNAISIPLTDSYLTVKRSDCCNDGPHACIKALGGYRLQVKWPLEMSETSSCLRLLAPRGLRALPCWLYRKDWILPRRMQRETSWISAANLAWSRARTLTCACTVMSPSPPVMDLKDTPQNVLVINQTGTER